MLGTVNTMRIFVPGMRERGWGRVVNLASMAGKDGNPNLSIDSASKAAVIGLTKLAGKELATTGVLVNAIAPAVIATPMNDGTAPSNTQLNEVRGNMAVLLPTGARLHSSILPATRRSLRCARAAPRSPTSSCWW